jgi:hypothetical protein
MPTLIPTLGPGQYFSSDDKPAVITTVGDDEFGYGEIAGHPDLYLVWVTDEAGTHYLVVDSKSTRFLGSESQDTFSELLKQRGSLLTQIGEKENLSRREQGQRYGYDGGAVAVAIVGVIACIIVTAGGCFLPFAAGALVLVGNAAAHNGASQAIQEDIPPLEASLDQVDSSLLGRFGALSTRTPSP